MIFQGSVEVTQQTIYSELYRAFRTNENFLELLELMRTFLELLGISVFNNYNGNFFRTFENFSYNNIFI